MLPTKSLLVLQVLSQTSPSLGSLPSWSQDGSVSSPYSAAGTIWILSSLGGSGGAGGWQQECGLGGTGTWVTSRLLLTLPRKVPLRFGWTVPVRVRDDVHRPFGSGGCHCCGASHSCDPPLLQGWPALPPVLAESGSIVSPLRAPPPARPGHGLGGRAPGEGQLCLWVSLACESQGQGTQLD